MAIQNFGAITPDGIIMAGAVRWSDSVSPDISWIVDLFGNQLPPVVGGVFEKSR